MSGAIAELERKIDVTQKVKDHPWTAVGVAFGAGFALSASRTDVRAAKVTADATRETCTHLGGAVDRVVAALIAGVAEALKSRIEDAVKEVVASIRGTRKPRPIGKTDGSIEVPIRAD
jgi:ElaB/YqjD/DUF883 family membrane-anchored ribosome-binding protein